MPNLFISKELAKWLKERGCEIGCPYLYDTEGKLWEADFFHSIARSDRDYVAGNAYSWYEILVTHAKEFWGEEEYNSDEHYYTVYEYNYWGQSLLFQLQSGDIQGAENWVREHSLFSKQEIK